MRKRICLTFEEFVKENMKVSVIDRSNQDLMDVELKVEETEDSDEQKGVLAISEETEETLKTFDEAFPSEEGDKR